METSVISVDQDKFKVCTLPNIETSINLLQKANFNKYSHNIYLFINAYKAIYVYISHNIY